jgi:hypothetical protein
MMLMESQEKFKCDEFVEYIIDNNIDQVEFKKFTHDKLKDFKYLSLFDRIFIMTLVENFI